MNEMNENSMKLLRFRKEIEACSKADAEAAVEAAQRAADEALSAAESEARTSCRQGAKNTVDELKAAERRRVSEMRFSENKRVLMHRGRLVDEFFGKVEAQIAARTEKPEYTAYLERIIFEAEQKFGLSGAEIYCRECDINTIEKLTLLKGAQVLPSDDIKLGGIAVKIPDKGILMDLSLDAALEKEREAFSSLKEMQL